MEEYYKSGRMLVNLAGAIGRIVLVSHSGVAVFKAIVALNI